MKLRLLLLLLPFLGNCPGETGGTAVRAGLPRVLAVQGLWHDLYRLPEAISAAGGAMLNQAFHYHGGRSSGLHYLHGEGVRGFPRYQAELAGFDVVVLNNVGASAFTREQQRWLSEFVQGGGGLLVLGGIWTLDRGRMKGTALEEVVPVELTKHARRLSKAPSGLVLTPASDRAFLGLCDWSSSPRTFFFHEVNPKKKSSVLVTASGKPMLILGRHGSGRTAVFAGSVCGDSPRGATAFWEWDDWPLLLGEVLHWLWEVRLKRPAPASTRKRHARTLSPDELEQLAFAEGKKKLALMRKAIRSCDAGASVLLFEELLGGTDLPSQVQAELLAAVRPYARREWGARLLKLKGLLDPAVRLEWIQTLGATRAPELVSEIVPYLSVKDVATRRAAARAFALLGQRSVLPILRRQMNESGRPSIDAARTEHEVRKLLPGPEDLRVDLLLALYCSGERGTPRLVLDMYDEYLFYSGYAAAYLRGPWPGPSDGQGRITRKELAFRKKFMRSQLRYIEELFPLVPRGLGSDFVEAAREEKRAHCLRLVYVAIQWSINRTSALDFLGLLDSFDPGVTRLTLSIISSFEDPRISKSAVDYLVRAWQDAPVQKRRQILLIARSLKPRFRTRLSALGIAEPHPKVRRLGRILARLE